MKALLFVPIILSLVILGAHFLREGSEVGVVVSIVLIGLLVVRRGWAARLVQLALFAGVVEWLLTIYRLAGIYAVRGEPATRMYIILGSVTGLTLVAALLFQTRTLKGTYGPDPADQADAE